MAAKGKGCYITWTTKEGASKVLRFDAILQENHTFKAVATSFPVEKGADITDHIRQEPDEINLEAFITNTPIHADNLNKPLGDSSGRGDLSGLPLDVEEYEAPLEPTPGAVFNAVGGFLSNLLSSKREYKALVLQFPVEFNSVSETLAVLKQLQETSQLVQVITPMWDYSNMALLDGGLPRTPADGASGRFQLGFKNIRVVETKQGTIPKFTEKRAQKEVPKGAKGLGPPSKPTAVDAKALDWLNQNIAGVSDFTKNFGGLAKPPGVP